MSTRYSHRPLRPGLTHTRLSRWAAFTALAFIGAVVLASVAARMGWLP